MNTDESCGIQENFKGGVAMADQFAVRTQEGVYLYRCNADKTSFARALSAPGATLSADYRELFSLTLRPGGAVFRRSTHWMSCSRRRTLT